MYLRCQIHHNYYMDNDFLRKKILGLVILLVLILIGIIIAIIYLKYSSSVKINIDNTPEEGEDFSASYGKIETGGVDGQAYNDINACMKKYLNAINIKSQQYGAYDEENNYVSTVQESEIRQTIYNLLSNKYVNSNNVTVDNVYNHVKLLQEDAVFVPIELSMIKDGEIKSFLVYGLIESLENYTVIDKIFAVVNIDFYENNFSIELIKGEYNSIKEIKVEQFEDNITANSNNRFSSEYISAKDMPDAYIDLYKRLALGYPEKMYELLDEQYRNARFGNVQKFKEYIKQNEENIKVIYLDKYKVVVDENKVQYICVDMNENWYIFEQNEPFQDYRVFLDTYTVDIPTFAEQYNNASPQEKVAMNIEKVITAINNKDYLYMYNKLDNTFKNSKYATENDFKNDIQNIFFKSNDIEYLEFSQEGNIYICKIKITDKNLNNAQEKNVNVIMQLGEGTEFKMSFNME